jgi:hypothetical protein
VRVSQILNRQDDLALKLRASRIRILAHSRKSRGGIEASTASSTHLSPRLLRDTHVPEGVWSLAARPRQGYRGRPSSPSLAHAAPLSPHHRLREERVPERLSPALMKRMRRAAALRSTPMPELPCTTGFPSPHRRGH